MKKSSWLFLLGFLCSCSNAPFALQATKSDIPPVQINLLKGQIKTATNNVQTFMPMSFTLTAYQCKKIVLQANQDSLQIRACYREKTVSLDSTLFHYIPLWKQGFTYRNISSGNLINTDIMIQSDI